MKNIQIIEGDLLDYEFPCYICHQCNTTTKRSYGLSSQVFKKYPKANVYKMTETKIPGTVKIIGNVINIFGQISPSKPKTENDSYPKRIEYFESCLNEISEKIPSESQVAFPYNIGCGLAGGDWKVYEKMIQKFGHDNPKMTIKIVRLNK